MKRLYNLYDPVKIQATCFRILARSGFHMHPRDADLLERFECKRDAFEKLRAMLYEDGHLGYVGHDKTRLTREDEWRSKEDPGISPKRWNRYRQLFETLGVSAVSHVGETITMRVSTMGLSSKGFVHSPAHRVIVPCLEYYPLPPERHAHIVLDGLWHIYYGWES